MIAISLVAAALLQAPAPTPDPREATLGAFKPIAVVEIEDGRIRRFPEIYSLYAPFSATRHGSGSRFLVWRRQEGGQSSWARVTECPAAESSLIELENVPLPQADIPLIGREDRQGPGTDAPTYRLWFQDGKWPEGYAYSASVAGIRETPLGEWAERFKNLIEPCWTSEEPLVRSAP
jgi:hypothetical protein